MTKQLALLAICLFGTIAALPAAPPEHSAWRLTFSDEFDGSDLDMNAWEVESGAPTHILSSRWPENIEVRDGVCRLVTRKEKRAGKEWTTAHMWTRTFRQKYGYFEARYRYGAAPGLNNAFWLMPRATGEQAGVYGMKGYLRKFEIDINEGHYPGKVNMNIHNWEGEHWSKHELWTSPDDLGTSFHTYGLEWTDKELIWYVDGVERRRIAHEICHLEVPVIFSTAVLKWAGKITEALDGAAMEVDYVRIYERTGPNPSAPDPQSATLARLAGSTPPPGYLRRWSDTFDGGKVDLDAWRYRTGPRLESFNRAENVFVDGGKAIIEMRKEPHEGKEYTAGGLITNRKYRYGYYEARAKMFGAAGWHQSVWAMAVDPAAGGPKHTEIDGIEYDSDDPIQAHTGVIVWDREGKNVHLTCSPGVYRRPLGFDATTGYHTYGFEWTEDKVRIFLDGQLNCVLDYPHTRHRHDPLNFWLTSVAHVSLAGAVDESALPGRMYIDHAAIYEKDLYIDDGDPDYSEHGAWKAIEGGFSFSPAREACATGPSASWRPDFLAADEYQVFLYRLPPSGAEGEASVTIDAAGGPAKRTVRFTKDPAAWADLGTYRFEAGRSGGVTIAPASGCVVADMVKFVRKRSATPAPERASDVLKDYQLAWSDDFEGDSLDTAKWRYRTGPRHWSVNLPENVSVADGKLRIALKKERSGDLDYTAGGVITKEAFRYGYYEARIKMPPGKGWHTSFWLMNHDIPSGTDQPKQEIDICEQDSIDRRQYWVNVHKWQGEHTSHGHKRIPTPDLSADFHAWGAEFTPEYVKFFFDGRLVATTDVGHFEHGDHHIWLTSIASHLGGTDRVDDANLPAYAEYDWVRDYERKPGAAPTR